MDDSKKIWRVNRTPRFTALEIGEYMAADDGPRETILRNMKYERLAPTLLYDTLNQGVKRHLTSPIRDLRILAECRAALEAERAAANNPQRKDNLTYELRALDRFEGSLNALGLREAILEPARVTGRKVPVEGVVISVRSTARVRISRPRGKDLVGSLIVDVAKGNASETEEAKAKLKRSMTHTAVVLLRAVKDGIAEAGEDVRVSPEHCIVFHTHSQERICAPTNSRAMMRNIEAVCRNIKRGWGGIDPPSTFDPSRARYRG